MIKDLIINEWMIENDRIIGFNWALAYFIGAKKVKTSFNLKKAIQNPKFNFLTIICKIRKNVSLQDCLF